jgi:uncharacterized protein
MINSIFVDSSILVEFIKGTKTNLLVSIITNTEGNAYINETVISEFLLYFIAINGNASPRTLKSSFKISSIFQAFGNYDLLARFSFLAGDDRLYTIVPLLMKKYNLLPNDAIILATCKIQNISNLASHDADFIVPCKAEGIELLREED